MNEKFEQLPEDEKELVEKITDALIESKKKKYVFSLIEKGASSYAQIKAESVEEAIEKFGGVDEVILPHQRFKKMHFGGIYEIKAEGETSPCRIIHSSRVLDGYGYHGGGRPRKDTEARRMTISISGTPTEIDKLKELAKAEGKTVSRFVLDNLVK